MALPNRKRSKSRKGVKQYQYRLKKNNLSKCSSCKKSIKPHCICPFCGCYNKKEIISKKTKAKKGKK
ncbi:MAG: 50S ribosomal protein L32 [Patescibacteria group bacterium]